MQKYYPDGIEQFDQGALDNLYAQYNALQETKTQLLRNKAPKAEVQAINMQLKTLSIQIKQSTQRGQQYAQSTKVYTTAVKYLRQAADYSRFGELHDKYNAIS